MCVFCLILSGALCYNVAFDRRTGVFGCGGRGRGGGQKVPCGLLYFISSLLRAPPRPILFPPSFFFLPAPAAPAARDGPPQVLPLRRPVRAPPRAHGRHARAALVGGGRTVRRDRSGRRPPPPPSATAPPLAHLSLSSQPGPPHPAPRPQAAPPRPPPPAPRLPGGQGHAGHAAAQAPGEREERKGGDEGRV